MVLEHFRVCVLVSKYMMVVVKRKKEVGLSIGRLLDYVVFWDGGIFLVDKYSAFTILEQI